jgi:hypothetical protein
MSPFTDKVDDLILRATELAMGDTLEGRTKVRVAPAPTGAGKTTASVALAAAGLMTDPSFTAGFVVEQIRQAEEVYRMLLALLPPEFHPQVAVWTTAHDLKASDEERVGHFGEDYSAPRVARDALGKARIAVGTHKRMEQDALRAAAGVLFTADGRRRSVVYVDETPAAAKLVEM